MFKIFYVLLSVLIYNTAIAQTPSWTPSLKPGETLVSVNGIPVSQIAKSTELNRITQPDNSNLGHAARYVVNRNQAAYNHALKEAQILANRGSSGHPMGCAPGSSRSGTGYSWNSVPNHCYFGQLPDSQLIARACVRGHNGAYFWSAHYR